MCLNFFRQPRQSRLLPLVKKKSQRRYFPLHPTSRLRTGNFLLQSSGKRLKRPSGGSWLYVWSLMKFLILAGTWPLFLLSMPHETIITKTQIHLVQPRQSLVSAFCLSLTSFWLLSNQSLLSCQLLNKFSGFFFFLILKTILSCFQSESGTVSLMSEMEVYRVIFFLYFILRNSKFPEKVKE